MRKTVYFYYNKFQKGHNSFNKYTESIAKSNTGPPPAPTNSNLQPLFHQEQSGKRSLNKGQ